MTSRKEGLAYIHSPCPTGWRFPENKTVEVARLAVLTGMWPLLEVNHDIFRLNIKPRELRPVSEHLRLQGRFKHLTEKEVAEMQELVNGNWKRPLMLDGKSVF